MIFRILNNVVIKLISHSLNFHFHLESKAIITHSSYVFVEEKEEREIFGFVNNRHAALKIWGLAALFITFDITQEE